MPYPCGKRSRQENGKLLVTRQQSIEFGQVGKIVILFQGDGKTFRQSLLDRFLLGLGEGLCLGKRREKQDPVEQRKKLLEKGSKIFIVSCLLVVEFPSSGKTSLRRKCLGSRLEEGRVGEILISTPCVLEHDVNGRGAGIDSKSWIPRIRLCRSFPWSRWP